MARTVLGETRRVLRQLEVWREQCNEDTPKGAVRELDSLILKMRKRVEQYQKRDDRVWKNA